MAHIFLPPRGHNKASVSLLIREPEPPLLPPYWLIQLKSPFSKGETGLGCWPQITHPTTPVP